MGPDLRYPAGAMPPLRDYFGYPQAWDLLRDLDDEGLALVVEEGGRGLVAPGVRVRLPLVVPDLSPETELDAVLDHLDAPLGRQLLVLVQAGATALGLWEDDELVAHKVLKTYVIRGHGKAQPKHLETRGKSREGTAARVAQWRREHGPFSRVFLSCPTRAQADFLPGLAPSLEGAGEPVRVPYDVRRPSYAEVLRVRSRLEHGWVERTPG